MRIIALAAMAVVASGLSAQPPAQGRMPVATGAESATGNLPVQKIGPDDLITVSVYNEPDLTRTVRVGPDGMIRLPLLRQPVSALGQLPSELETKVAGMLQSEHILVDPVVTVTLVESRSRPITVSGAVRTPSSFQVAGSMTLLDALARSGGLAKESGSEILVSRPNPNGGAVLTQRIPVKALSEQTDPSLNLKLAGGEDIRVPEAGRIFVVGNVRASGAFPITNPDDATVMKMLALAGGPSQFANKQAYIYRKEAGVAGKNEIPVELSKILDRKAPDVPLLADDVLYIPDAKGRRLTMTMLSSIIAAGGAAAITSLVLR